MSDRVMRERVAVAAEIPDRRRLSYREVATAAGLLAATLTAAGVRPGDVVAVGVRSGWEQPPAVLGVVQTGAIYVPVDPTDPRDQIDLLLHDCAARFAVTTLADADRWPVETTVIILETVWRYGLNAPTAAEDNGAAVTTITGINELAIAESPAVSRTVLIEPQAREQLKEQAQWRHAADGEAVGIGLPHGKGPDRHRRSVRKFSGARVELDVFGALLDTLRQWTEDGTVRRAWASAAGFYPVDVYVQVQNAGVSALATGVYRYAPEQHQLVPVSDEQLVQAKHHSMVNQEACDTAGFSLFLVADIAALGRLYGDHAEPYCLLEAGAMAHALTTAAARLGIATCQIGMLDFGDAKEALGLSDTEKLLGTIMGGTQ